MKTVHVGFTQCQLRYDYVEGTKTSPVGYLERILAYDAKMMQVWFIIRCIHILHRKERIMGKGLRWSENAVKKCRLCE